MPPLEPNQFLGHWRITEMEVWGRDYLDLVVPAYISFDEDDDGAFQFGTVRGWLDCEFGERDGLSALTKTMTGLSSLALSEVGLIASSVNVTVSRVWSSHGKASTIKMKLADADGQS
jgi:hypothetical protein